MWKIHQKTETANLLNCKHFSLPSPCSHHFAVCLYDSDCFRHLMCMKLQGMAHIALLNITSSRFNHAVAYDKVSFLNKAEHKLLICIYHIFLIHLSMDIKLPLTFGYNEYCCSEDSCDNTFWDPAFIFCFCKLEVGLVDYILILFLSFQRAPND